MRSLLLLWLALATVCGSAFAGDELQDYLTAKSYEYKLTLSLDDKQTFTGEANLKLNTTSNVPWNTTYIVLSGAQLTLNEVTVIHPSGLRQEVVLTSIKYNRHLETITIPIREMLINSGTYSLRILYTGKYNSTGGLFKANVSDSQFIGTQLYPCFSRRVFISLDQPGNVAPVQITFNGISSKDVTVVTGLKPRTVGGKTVYASEAPIPLSAAFFTLGTYTKAGDVNFWYPNGGALFNYLTATSALKLAAVNDLYTAAGLKPSLVVVPGLPTDSESGYAITALSMDLAFETAAAPSNELKTKAIQIITALVKSLFANVVTPKTWSDIWIAESTSLYIASRTYTMLPRWKEFADYTPEILSTALAETWSANSLPVQPKFTNTSQLLTYLKDPAISKGAVILAMIDNLKNDDMLAFKTYLKDRKGQSVTTEDFLSQLAENKQLNETANFPEGQTLQEILEPWLNQTGYPALILDRKDKDIMASAIRYGPQGVQGSGWVVPIQYQRTSNSSATNDGQETAWLIPGPNAELTLEKDLDPASTVLLNTRGVGLYRTKYDDVDLRILGDILSSNSIQSIKPNLRATILRDVFSFAKSGQLKYSVLIDFLQYLNQERDTEPWVVAIAGIQDLWTYLYFTNLRVQFENVFGDLMRPTYKELSFNATGILKGMLMRELISAHCDYDDQDCLDDTKAAFQSLSLGSRSTIASDLIPVIYCNGLRDLKDKDVFLSYLTKNYSSSAPQYSKKNVFSYLACPGDNSTINTYLQNLLIRGVVDDMPADDVVMAFEEVASRPEHLDLCFTFITRNFASLKKTLTEEHRIRLIKILGQKGSTKTHIDALKDFTFGDSANIKAAVNEALEGVQARQKFMQDNSYEISLGLYGRPVEPSPEPTPPHTEPTRTTSTGPTTTTTPSPTPSGGERAAATALATSLLALLVLTTR